MAAVAGLRGTGDWGADERPKNFRETILKRNPNGTAPIFALMAKARKENTDDPEFSWWDEPNDLVRLQVNGALVAGDTLITVDSADPSTSAPGNTWGVASHLAAGDLLLVEPAADSATYNHEIIEVTQVHSDTQFSARRGAAGTTAGAIANDLYLVKIGSNFAEGTGAPEAVSRNPIKYYNYTQIFKTVYELTGTAEQTNTRTGDPVQQDKIRRMWDHSRDLELAMLFGQRSEITGSNGKPKRTMGGLRSFIPSDTTTILAANWTIANPAAAGNSFLDAIAPVFNFDSPAGDERMIFCGANAANRFNQAIHKGTGVGATTIQFMGMEKVYGMQFMRFNLPQGSVFMKIHPLLNRHALYQNSMFILDFSAIKYRPMRGRDTKPKDNIQASDEDVRRGMWQTEAGLEVNFGGLTCGYIGGFDAAIA